MEQGKEVERKELRELAAREPARRNLLFSPFFFDSAFLFSLTVSPVSLSMASQTEPYVPKPTCLTTR